MFMALTTSFPIHQVHYSRTDSLWHFLHLLTKLTFYTCSNLEEKLDYSNHFTYNVLLFVVDLNAQPQAPDVLRFQTLVSDFSCLESHPRALCRSQHQDKCPHALLCLVKNQRYTRTQCLSAFQQK